LIGVASATVEGSAEFRPLWSVQASLTRRGVMVRAVPGVSTPG